MDVCDLSVFTLRVALKDEARYHFNVALSAARHKKMPRTFSSQIAAFTSLCSLNRSPSIFYDLDSGYKFATDCDFVVTNINY